MKNSLSALVVLLAPLILVMLLAAGPAAAIHAGDSDYRLGSVPFGKAMSEVLKDFEGSGIKREETPLIESVGNYALDEFFKGGLQKKEDSGACFYPQIVQKYTVTVGAGGVREMTLYFQGFELPEKPFSLFMVKKTFTHGEDDQGKLRQVFDRRAQPITEAVGKKPQLREGTFQDFSGQRHDYFRPALVGIWDTGDTLVFLMVADSEEGPTAPQLIMVHKKELATYLKACKIIRDGG